MICGIVGIVNYNKNIAKEKDTIVKMSSKLSKQGLAENSLFLDKHVGLAHKQLSVLNFNDEKQPITIKANDNIYTLVFDGKIYNISELRKELIEFGVSFSTHSDTEVLLKGYIYWGKNILNKLNGIFSFAIWDNNKEELFLARDHFGIKPLYYYLKDNNFIFSSEVKAILEHPEVETILDSDGIYELFGIGPAHTPGTTLFKNINEFRPAEYGVFNRNGLYINKYWKLENKPHTDSLNKTAETIKYFLEDSIKKQLVTDAPVATMLSGGLDSSLISAYANNIFKKNNQILNTYSVDYLDNNKNFVKSEFQPNSDNYYIDIMTKYLNCKHHTIVLDTPELADSLKDAVIARDFPGMADVDSSLLLFCKEMKNDIKVAISGECADEIFGGYPWFFNPESLRSNTFPWSLAVNERQKLLTPELQNSINLKKYVDFRYNESLAEVETADFDSPETAEKRKIFHLNFNWFMQTLLDRADKMSRYAGIELRVPFCDYRLVQYVWNIPWDIKALKGREKGLLRYVAKGILPDDIVDRKKSPFPKTHNPTYLEKVKGMLENILNNNNAPIKSLLSYEHLQEILDTDGTSFIKPWFGQLMTGPQLMAYLCQVNMWLEIYNPKIII